MPTISVVVPVYDGERFLGKTIDSVLSQTLTTFECILIDDGSTDGTRDILAQLDDERVRVITHETNRGLSAARNSGIDAARAPYIVFLDADDILDPTALAELLSVISSAPSGCGGVFTGYRRISGGQVLSERQIPEGRTDHADLAAGNVIGGPSCTLFRTTVCQSVGGFDENLVSREDIDFYLRVTEHYYLLGYNNVLYSWRDHKNQMTKNTERMLRGQIYFLEKHSSRLTSSHRDRRRFWAVKAYVSLGQVSSAKRLLRTLIKSQPFRYTYYFAYLSLLFGSRGFHFATMVHRVIKRR